MVLLDIASHPDHLWIEQGRLEAGYHYTGRGIPVFNTGLQAFSMLRRIKGYYWKRNDGSPD